MSANDPVGASLEVAYAGRNPWILRGLGFLVAVLIATVLLVLEPRSAIGWDEGYTLGREARVRAWIRGVFDPKTFARTWNPKLEFLVQDSTPPPARERLSERSRFFDRDVVRWFWPFAREEPHGHPPFYALVGLVGDVLTPDRAPLERARLGPILFFSATAGLILAILARRWGILAGATACAAWVCQPRLFAEARYAAYDGLLSSLWIVAILVFTLAVEKHEIQEQESTKTSNRNLPKWLYVVLFGLVLGAAMGTKLTGWTLPALFAAWTVAFWSRRGLITLAIGCAVAVGVVVAINPPWWFDPWDGVARFFRSNATRARTIPIATMYLGRIYITPKESLPWTNTLVWTAFVTPAGILALACCGFWGVLKRPFRDGAAALAAGGWMMMLILRALPHTPGHDGVRQFLPAFGSLALVAGWGAMKLNEWIGVRVATVVVALAALEGAAGIALLEPVPLSYYSPLVGGLAGATKLGMEPTYYWDSLSNDAIDWINKETPEGAKVRFASYPTSWLYLRMTGRLRPACLPTDRGRFAWYVVQNRPGSLSDLDRYLLARAEPRYVERKWGVPLLWIFPYAEVEAWRQPRNSRLKPSDSPLQ